MRKLFLIILVFAVLGNWSVTAQEVPWTDKIFGNIEDAERIVFAVDTSGSIRDAGRLPLEKTLVIEIVGMLIDSGRNPMVEVIAFDSDISVIVELAALNAVKDNIIPAINGIQDTDNLTWMNGAIDHACSITKPVHPNGALVLSTDGKPTTAERNGSKNIRAAGTATEVAAEKFRNECSTLTIIGIDVSGEAEEFLKGIASPGAYVTVKIPQTFFRPGDPEVAEVVVPQVKACERELDINVDVEMFPWENAYERLLLNVAAGNAPDIGYIPSSRIPELAEAEYIIPIDVSREGKAEYFESIWSTVTWKGDIYGIPRALFNHALYYNTGLFEEAGIAGPPTTWEELVEAAAAITERTGAYGFALTGRRSSFTVVQFLNFLFQNSGGVYDEKGDIIINNANGVEALEFYVSLTHYTPPEAIGMTESDLGELFARGEVGMFVSGPRWMDGFEEAGTPFKTASLPAGPNGWSTGVVSSHSLVVFSQSEHQEEARELALCITKYEHQAELDAKLRMMPMRREEAEEIDLFQTDHWKGFISMIPKGTPLPLVTGWGKFEDVVAIAIEYAAAGMMTPEEALNQTALELERLKEEGIKVKSDDDSESRTVTVLSPEWGSHLSDIQESSVQVGWGSFHKDMFSKRGETRAFILGGKTYQKGLDTHAPAHVIYNLNGQFKKFQSFVGLWDSGNPDRGLPGDFAGNRGSVRFIVVLDGQQVYDSGVMRWDTPAKSIDIDVSGAQILELRVMDVENLAYDWSIWADAKLLK